MDVERAGLGDVLQQVVHLLIVDLQKRTEDLELGLVDVLLGVGADGLEQQIDGPGGYARVVLIGFKFLEEGLLLLGGFVGVAHEVLPVVAEHRVRLACVRLTLPEPVCPYAKIVRL